MGVSLKNFTNGREGSKGVVQTATAIEKRWDPVSQIILKTGAKRGEASADAPNVLVKLAVYARYSTDHQKASSIERQVASAEKLALAKLGQTKYSLYSDIGESAATVNQRSKLLALIEAIKRGEITDVIIEDFDRLSRDLNDASDLNRMFEKYSVKLWIVRLGRPIERMELFEHAKHAENDRRRRTALLSAGIDQLVEAGGVPQSAGFGYVKSGRPGYPTICPVASLAIQRMFELLLTLSDTKTAMQLKREGFVSPNATVGWDRNTVSRLRNRMIYIGVIHNRRTKQTRKENGERSRVAPRPLEEWVSGHNEDMRIVSDELFLAVYKRKMRKSAYKVAEDKDAPRRLYPLGNPVCDCAEAETSQHFENGNNLLSCKKGGKFANCTRTHGQNIQSRDIEKEGMRLFFETLTSALSENGLHAYVKQSILSRVAALAQRRSHIEAHRLDANRKADKLLDLLVEGSEKRLKQRLADLELEIDSHEAALANMPLISLDEIDFVAMNTSLRGALALFENRVPFLTHKPFDEATFNLFRRVIKRVVIERSKLPVGRIGIRLELALDELFLDVQQAAALDPCVTVVRTEISVRRSYKSDPAREELNGLAKSGVYALTDEQWTQVSHLLPDMQARAIKVKHALPTRQVADALLFKMRTGVASERLPPALGPQTELRFCTERLTRAGGAEVLIDVLGSPDPDWAAGLSIDGLTATRINPMFERSAQLARRLSSRDYRFTDEQWTAFEAEINRDSVRDHKYLGKKPTRRSIEDVFLKLRAHCGFKVLDEMEPGSSDRAAAAAKWLVNVGVWQRIIAVCETRFPVLLDRLDLDYMLRLSVSESTLSTRKKLIYDHNAHIGARAIKICTGLLEAPAKASGMAVFRSLIAPSPGKSKTALMRAHIVVGRTKPAVGHPCRDPFAVIIKTATWRLKTDVNCIQICRRVRGLSHLIFVRQDSYHVEHHYKVGTRWVVDIKRNLAEAIVISQLNLNIALSEIYEKNS